MSEHPTLAAVASAFPAQQVERDRAFETMVTMFPGEDPRSISSLLERSGVGVRHVAPPLEFILGDSDFSARNAQWYVHALELSQRAIRKALERARIAPSDIDCVIDVSCTGVTIPALDAELVQLLAMRSDVRRIPIT
ncbi:MAG: hypothetical protein ABI054_12565, partial [Planctomycetota bacterium]